MDRRPVGPPQMRSGVVGMGRGRIRNNADARQQKKSRFIKLHTPTMLHFILLNNLLRDPRPGPSGGASLAANFNVQPRAVEQPRRELSPPAQVPPLSRPSKMALFYIAHFISLIFRSMQRLAKANSD